ncbi:MAG: adenylate/guanylate cyclase domain-containing protein [Candidatus Pristimantibacillus lignocellulolyticus]|uniref:Adenylate/guanylate cyclase domain-containing protein n=1 Tax=Candidatus Pristimantibacillus lignocellulolyticus TaxID=2994561 RepID=A0A9J6ZFS1_9BACL|nr:MAG: adenylate/guanylate cyclase domain-containing protein [Candidatus Pristimantibacillus lignocellulolyticus]
MKSTIRKTFIIVNILLLFIVIFSYQLHGFQKLETIMLDMNMKQSASHDPDPHIVVVAIDNDSIEALGQFPWDRAVYASFLEMVNQVGYEPASIAFDLTFSDASNEESDLIFSEALSAYDNVILPVVGVTSGDVFQTSVVREDQYLQTNHVFYPYDLLARHAQFAHINRVVSHDGVIRQAWLNIQAPDGTVIPSLAYKAVKMAGVDISFYDEFTDRQKTSDPLAKNTMTIDYELVTDDFLTVPFVNVLYGEIPPETFQNAIVFVGATATGISGDSGQDSGPTPLERDAKLVYVHANIANQLLQGSYIQYAPNLLELSLIIIAYVLFMLLPWRLKNLYTFSIVIVSIVVIYFAQQYSYEQFNYHISIVYVLLGMLLAYVFNVSLKSYMEQSQKNFVTRQFGRYISPDLVKDIVKQGMDIQIGGISKRITILFLDIRGFTSLAEKLTPAEVVDVLNTKFTMITKIALENNGTIDKFIGDAAMILFNAPLDVREHEKMAVLTAYQIQQNMKPIHDQLLEKYGVEVNIGIGIHTGNVVIGNIGSYLRMDYTAIGDSVNIASRIESGTAAGQIMVSEEVYKATSDLFEYGDAEEKMFKGKSQVIAIYELLSIK